MKRYQLATFLFILLFVFTLTGCGDIDDRREDALEDKVKQLELQVAELQNQIADKSALSTSTESPVNESSSDASTEESTPLQTEDPTDTLETLASAVDEITAKTDSAVPESDPEEMRNQFFALKNELEAVDRRLDNYDDYLEQQYRQKTLSYDDYLTQERDLENLEDKLDTAEDSLERTFGIDD